MLETRSQEPELLDAPGFSPELARKSYIFMERVNRYFGGISNVRRFIAEEASRRQPLRVLDIGSGACDIPLALCDWARRNGVDLRFTCLEIEPEAMAIAKEKLARERSWEPQIELLAEDAFTHRPAQPYDCATSSMCFHHFSDEKILELLEHLRGIVSGRVFINDLRREPLALLGAVALSAFSDPGVKHDSRLSVRRGFRVDELRTLLKRLENAAVKVEAAWLYRVAASIEFRKEGAQ